MYVIYIIEYTDYSPNEETVSIDDYSFYNINNAIDYLEQNGFTFEHDNVYKKGELYGARAVIKTTYLYEDNHITK